MTRRAFVTVMVALVMSAGCSSFGHGTSRADESIAALAQLRQHITEVHRTVAADAANLAAALGDCPVDRGPAREAWRTLRLAWDRAAVFRFGPQATTRLAARVDFWPSKAQDVESFAARTGPVTADDVGALGAGAVGLPALEVLLFSATPLDARRCAYARALASEIESRATTVADEWDRDAADFAHADRALADVVSALADALYRVADDQLAMPAGSRAGSEPDPTLVRGGDAAMALADAASQLESIERAYAIAVAPSLAGRPADEGFRTAIARAKDAVTSLDGDLRTMVVDRRNEVLAASEASRQARLVLATQVAGSLGLTLNIAAGDGD